MTGTVLGVCMCKPPTQDSLTLWIEHIQKQHPLLRDVRVIYDVTVLDDMSYETNNELFNTESREILP
jgi:hypothetical protein